jgi:hypothetical protein
MRPTFKFSTQLALTSLLSLALSASIGLGQAQAQNNASRGRSGATRMARDHDSAMSDRDRMDDDGDMRMPAALSYPMAAPGSLHLNHWTDYTRTHMAPGSATETRMEKMDDRDRDRAASRGRMEDKDELLPVTPMYPHAAPGSLGLNYWTDETREHMMPGSATEARMDKMHDRDRERAAAMGRMEDEDDLLPAAPGYPMAAPGSLHLNHWTDYTRTHMAPGSATETRMEKMMKKDREKRMR